DGVRGKRHHDRDFVGCVLGGADRGFAANYQNIDRKTHELSGECRETIEMTLSITVFHCEMLSLAIAEVAHPEQKLTAQVRLNWMGWRSRFEVTHAENVRLLRARRERPRSRCTAEQRHELAAPHSITSSARASNVAGISTPMVLAVCRLMTSSNLVACIIGKSAAFSPLRMRPV